MAVVTWVPATGPVVLDKLPLESERLQALQCLNPDRRFSPSFLEGWRLLSNKFEHLISDGDEIGEEVRSFITDISLVELGKDRVDLFWHSSNYVQMKVIAMAALFCVLLTSCRGFLLCHEGYNEKEIWENVL